MHEPRTHTGYLPTPKRPRDWRAGGVEGSAWEPIVPSGDWRPYLPVGEYQGDSMGCVSYSFNNALEMASLAAGNPLDFSDRALAKMSGTTDHGNNFWSVWFTAHRQGLLSETFYPARAGMTFDEYYEPLPPDLLKAAAVFLLTHDVEFRWVEGGVDAMLAALPAAPLWVASRGHAYVVTARDAGGWATFDSFPGPDGDFKGFHPDSREFDAVAQVRMVDKTFMPTPAILLPEECLVFEAEGLGRWGLHVKGRLLVDDLPKLEGQWLLRNRDAASDLFHFGPLKAITTADFDSLPHYDLKGNPL